MTLPKKAFLAGVALLAAFAFGRHSATFAPTTTVAETKKEVEKEINKEVRENTVIVHEKQPDGKETTTTIINKETKTVTNETKNTESSTKTVVKRSLTTVNGLIGTSVNDLNQRIYGISVTREVLGPVTVGVWGLTNGTAGVSVGLSF
jgi:hypothetical protein